MFAGSLKNANDESECAYFCIQPIHSLMNPTSHQRSQRARGQVKQSLRPPHCTHRKRLQAITTPTRIPAMEQPTIIACSMYGLSSSSCSPPTSFSSVSLQSICLFASTLHAPSTIRSLLSFAAFPSLLVLTLFLMLTGAACMRADSAWLVKVCLPIAAVMRFL